MTSQNYCMVNETTNVCENVVMWDGNPETWTPPSGSLMLIQATTSSKVWGYDAGNNVWSLVAGVGGGQIGFTWDGLYLTTNEPEPAPTVAAPNQPNITGAQTL
jgi:hypothetical protein